MNDGKAAAALAGGAHARSSMSAGKHEPVRSCAACRKQAPRGELVRFCVGSDGRLRVDPAQVAGGRGAYLCAAPDCLVVAERQGGLARVLRRNVAVPAGGLKALVGGALQVEWSGLQRQGAVDGRLPLNLYSAARHGPLGRLTAQFEAVAGIADADEVAGRNDR